MRPIFCGNFEFDARSSDLERLFRRYGKVDRVDMKSGFAFIYMEDDRDAEYAIRALDRTEFGRKGRRLRVEWTKHERGGGGGGIGGGRESISSRRSANLRPSKTLFVINFPYDTKTRDLERHFDPYGKIVNVRIRRNFAFVQYESQEDATKALDATNMSKMMGRVISVEYAVREDDDRRSGGGYSPDRRGRDRSPDRRRRSPSPYKRERGSPDYGAGSSPAPYRRERASPEYGHGPARSPPRRAERASPGYDRSPPRRVERASPGYDRSPPRRGERASPGYDRSPPRRGERTSPGYDRVVRSPSPVRRERASPPEYRDRSRSRSRSPRGRERNGNGYGSRPSTSPYQREEVSPERARLPRSPVPRSPPVSKPDLRDSPAGEYESPLDDRYRSASPVARERSES